MAPLRTIALAGAALAAAWPAGADAGAGSADGTAVGVGAREWSLGVYRTQVPRGLVRFNLANYGEDRHDLVVLDRDGRQLARSREVKAGARTTLSVRLAPGRYRLVCDLADHASRGMRASLLVTRPRPRPRARRR